MFRGKHFDEHFHLLLVRENATSQLFSATELLRGETIEKAGGVLYCANDRAVDVILEGRPLLGEENQITGCLIALLDITDRRQAEYKLQSAHHQLELATLAAGAGTWDWNIKTGHAEWSDDTFRLYGLDARKDKPSFEKWLSAVHPDDAEKAQERLQHAIKHQEPYVGDYRIVKPDGQIRWIIARGKALYDENGSPERVTGICIDNTKQKLSEARIIQQNTLLDGINHIFQESAACQTEQELSAVCLEVALDLTESKFGFIGEIGTDGLIYDLTARGSRPATVKADQQRQGNPQCAYEVAGLCEKVLRESKSLFVNESGELAESVRIPEGHPPFTAYLAVPLVLDERANGIIVVCNREGGYSAIQQDILEDLAPSILRAILAKRSELIINHQAKLLSMVNDAIIAFDLDKKITYWNTAAVRMYGWKAEEVFGKTAEDLMNPTAAAETIARRDACMKRGDIFRDEFVHRRKDGSAFWVEESSCALFDDERKIYGYIAANRNISNRKKEEEEKKDWTARLEAANRELESFSYSVSHDLRAPLRAIDGYSRMILRKHGANFDPDAVNKFNEIRLNTQKMGQLIDDLLSFSRMGRVELAVKMLDMEELIEDVWRAMIQQVQERKITFTLVKPIPKGLGDLAMIRQVLSNLLDNAVKFTSWKEEASIEVGGYPQGAENIYYVKDNGAGFDMQYYDKLFGVFQRLHAAEDFAGTGVGLAIVRRILKRLGGRSWAEGETDKGACFYFSLPSVTF